MICPYDLIVVGGGAAGLAAVRTARHKGASVAMVTDGPPGGDCTFWGCVPSKTFIAQAAKSSARNLDRSPDRNPDRNSHKNPASGTANGIADFKESLERVAEVVSEIAATESADVLRAEGVDVIEGTGTFESEAVMRVNDKPVWGRKFVIATGAAPLVPEIDGLDGVEYLTNENVFELPQRPEFLLVVGGGPIGCELAQAFARFGTRVTLCESAERILPDEEIEASEIIRSALEKDGVEVLTDSPVTSNQITRSLAPGGLAPGSLKPGSQITGSPAPGNHVLFAVGRAPATANLGLENVNIKPAESGAIPVKSDLSTSNKSIWAAGDVTGLMPFSHAADMMGRIAASNALKSSSLSARIFWPARKFHPSGVPYAIFCDPEVARVGVKEADAPPDARVAYLPLSKDDRSRCAGRTEGYVKLIASARKLGGHLAGGKIIGATIVSPRAGEMIQEPALAMSASMLPARLALLPHAYPTYSSAIQKAAAQFFVELDGQTWRKPFRT